MQRQSTTVRNRRLATFETLEPRLQLSAISPANDSATLFLARFDGSLSGDDGEQLLVPTSTKFSQGIIGRAMDSPPNGADSVRYFIKDATGENINSLIGTVEFWIRPNWNGFEEGAHNFFQVGQQFKNGMILSIDGANNLRFIQWGDKGDVEDHVERGLAFFGGDWVAREWHHVAATWNGDTGNYAFYIDGKEVASATDGVRIAAFTSNADPAADFDNDGDVDQDD